MANLNSATWNKCYAAFSEALIDAGQQVTKQGATMLTRACEDWLDKTDKEWPRPHGDHDHPWLTGTLHDSIATRIADGKHTISARYMSASATGNQSATADETGTRDYGNIVGAQFGRLMMGRASRVSQDALAAQMTIGVPYAQFVDSNKAEGHGDHSGYINDLQVDFISSMEGAILPVRNFIFRPRK